MKKKLYLLSLAFAAMTSGLIAQDFAIFSLNPVDGATIKANADFYIAVTAEAVEAFVDPNIKLEYAFNSDKLTEAFDQKLTGSLPAGLKLTMWQPLKTPNGNIGDTVEFVAVLSTSGDINKSNDTMRVKYILGESGGKDLKISITNPANGTQVKTWTTLPMTVKINNLGTETLPSNTPLIYSLKINGAAQGQANFFNYTGDPIKPGDSADLSLNLEVSKYAQTGSSDFCFTVSWGQQVGNQISSVENVRDNNEGCFNIEIQPNAINEGVLTVNSLFYANNGVHMSLANVNIQDGLRCEVMDINGRVIVSKNLPEINQGEVFNYSIELPTIEHGIYLMNIYDGDRPVASQKFMAY